MKLNYFLIIIKIYKIFSNNYVTIFYFDKKIKN